MTLKKKLFFLIFFINISCTHFLNDLKEDEDDEQSDILEKNKNLTEKKVNMNLYEEKNKPYVASFALKKRFKKEDFIDPLQEEGSLWASSGQTNYYFIKNKVRSPGDLIVLTIEEMLKIEIEEKFKKFFKKDEVDISGYISKNNESSEEKLEKKENSNRSISSSVQIKTGDTMIAEITDRLSNGNYKIKATKKIIYKSEFIKSIIVTGIVKSSDLNDETDVVSSSKLYDSKIETISL